MATLGASSENSDDPLEYPFNYKENINNNLSFI